MSNFNNNGGSDRPLTILDTGKATMWAPNGEGKFANLRFNVNKRNQVVATVYTNIPNDTVENGRIKAEIDPEYFHAWMASLEQAIRSNEAFRAGIVFTDKKFIGPGRMTDGPVEQWTLVAGRDDQGIVFVSVVAPKRPNIKFSMLSNQKHSFRDAAGNEMDKRLESTIIAAGKLVMLRDSVGKALDTAKTEVVRKQPGGGQGGGFQRGGNGGGGVYNGGGNRGGYQGNGGGQGGGGGAGASGGADAGFGGGGEDIPW